jgi:hypothetical protein
MKHRHHLITTIWFIGLALGMCGVGLANQPGLAQTGQKVATQPLLASTRWQAVTHDPELAQALSVMTQGPAARSLSRIVRGGIWLTFKDMASIAPTYQGYDALAWMTREGGLVIFVNEKHRQAPPQALAALLAHEATHDDAYNSVREEIAGWNIEASTWQFYCQSLPSLNALTPLPGTLVERLNRLREAQNTGELERLVRSNAGYRQLPEYVNVP